VSSRLCPRGKVEVVDRGRALWSGGFHFLSGSLSALKYQNARRTFSARDHKTGLRLRERGPHGRVLANGANVRTQQRVDSAERTRREICSCAGHGPRFPMRDVLGSPSG
jgi:hypothetical protein